MIRIWEIIKKDFKIIASDRKALFIILAMPLLLTGILSMALKGSFQPGGKTMAIPVALVVEGNETDDRERFLGLLRNSGMAENISQETVEDLETAVADLKPVPIFQDDFLGSEELASLIDLSVMTREAAEEALTDTTVHAVIILPKTFSYDMYVNLFTPFRNRMDVEVLGHPDYQYNLRIVQEVVGGFFQVMNTGIIEKNTLLAVGAQLDRQAVVYEHMDEVLAGFEGGMENVKIENVRGIERIHIDSFTYYAAAMLAMFVLFTAGFGSRSLLTEKRDHTASRMQSAGVSMLEMLIGKWVMMLTLTVCQMTILFAVSRFAFGVKWTQPLGLIVTALFAGAAIASLGTMISVISYRSNNYKVANLFESVLVQVMALLGGSYIPLEVLPKGFGMVSPFTINGLTLDAILTLQRGFGWNQVAGIWLALAVIAALLLLVSLGIGKWKGGIRRANDTVAQIETA